MKNLMVVIDMVNGFINEGNLADSNINRIVPRIVRHLTDAIENDYDIVAFKDCHTENDEEFKQFPPHCIKGTSECELIPELKEFEKDMLIIEKSTTNGFNTAKFRMFISANKYDNIIVCGCCSDICVYNFVKSLNAYLKQKKLETKICIYEDCIDTFNAPNHNADDINALYLDKMFKLGVNIIETVKAYVKDSRFCNN